MRRGTEQMRTNCLFLRRSIFGCQAISGLSVEEPAKEMAHHQLLGAARHPLLAVTGKKGRKWQAERCQRFYDDCQQVSMMVVNKEEM